MLWDLPCSGCCLDGRCLALQVLPWPFIPRSVGGATEAFLCLLRTSTPIWKVLSASPLRGSFRPPCCEYLAFTSPQLTLHTSSCLF